MINYGYGVSLDTIEYDDLETMRLARNDRRINEWCRQSGLICRNGQGTWWEKLTSDPSRKMYVIKDTNGIHVGVCGLTDIDHFNQRAEFSLLINPDYQRKGLARAALKTLLRHGFMDLNFVVIWGETFQGNHALKLFTAVGMTVDGMRPSHYFKNGRHIDAHLISMTRARFDIVTSEQWMKMPNLKQLFDDADISNFGGKSC